MSIYLVNIQDNKHTQYATRTGDKTGSKAT